MGLEITTLAIIGLVMSATGMVVGAIEQRKARKNQLSSNALRKQAEEKSEAVANLQTQRARRATAREAQAKSADIKSTAVTQGVGGSSAVQGSRGSVSTQLASNLSFLDTVNKTQTQATQLFGQAQEVASRPAGTIGRSLTSLGGTVFAGREDISSGLKSIFG